MSLYVAAAGCSGRQDVPLSVGGENTIVLDPPGTLVGKVVDETTGQPIREFRLQVDSSWDSRDPEEPTPMLPVAFCGRGKHIHAEAGAFKVPDVVCRAPYAVTVSAKGYASLRIERIVAQTADSPSLPTVFRLGQGLACRGRLVDAESGRPIAGADLRLLQFYTEPAERFRLEFLRVPSRARAEMRKALADPDGAFEFKAIGTWGKPLLAVSAPGHGVRLLRPAEADIGTVRLARAGAIVGSLKGAPGLKADNALVQAANGDIETEPVAAQADGSFAIDGLAPGDWVLKWPWRRHVPVKVEPGQTVRVDFAKLPGFALRGRVLRSGKPVPEARVMVYSSAHRTWIADAPAGPDGRYALSGLLPGDYAARLVVGNDPGETRHTSIADKDVEMDFTVFSGRIRGRLLDASGKPYSGYSVVWRQQAPEAPPASMLLLDRTHGRNIIREGDLCFEHPSAVGLRATRPLAPERYVHCGFAQAGADGRLERAGLAPGTYLLRTPGPDHDGVPHFLPGIRIERDGETAEAEVRLDGRGALRLKVIDAETQRPVAKAHLTVCTPGGLELTSFRRVPTKFGPDGRPAEYDPHKIETYETNAEGVLALDGLQRADYGLWVFAVGYGARWAAPVRAAEQAPETVVRLDPAGVLVLKVAPDVLKGMTFPCLTYRVRDAAGRPVFAHGEELLHTPLDCSAFMLFGKGGTERRIEVIPPGRYTLDWEIHEYPHTSGLWNEPTALPASARGKADFEIRKGGETVLPLVPAR